MHKKGFTLIELIVVVGIIGLLSALAIISLSRQQARSRDSKRLGDITNINTAIQGYIAEKLDPFASVNDYNGWDLSSAPTSGPNATDFITTLRDSGYMQKVPVDPVNNATSTYWWSTTLNGFTYGYKWIANDYSSLSPAGYWQYFLGANLELAGNPAITNQDFNAAGRQFMLKSVPVRPAN